MTIKNFIEHDTPASVEDLKKLATQSGIDALISWEIPSKFEPNKDYIFNIITLKNKNVTGHYCCVHKGVYFDCFGLPPPLEFQIQHPEVKRYYPKQLMDINDSECWIDCLIFIKDYKGQGRALGVDLRNEYRLTDKQQEIKKVYEDQFKFNFNI